MTPNQLVLNIRAEITSLLAEIRHRDSYGGPDPAPERTAALKVRLEEKRRALQSAKTLKGYVAPKPLKVVVVSEDRIKTMAAALSRCGEANLAAEIMGWLQDVRQIPTADDLDAVPLFVRPKESVTGLDSDSSP
jgi:hypothetical protein